MVRSERKGKLAWLFFTLPFIALAPLVSVCILQHTYQWCLIDGDFYLPDDYHARMHRIDGTEQRDNDASLTRNLLFSASLLYFILFFKKQRRTLAGARLVDYLHR